MQSKDDIPIPNLMQLREERVLPKTQQSSMLDDPLNLEVAFAPHTDTAEPSLPTARQLMEEPHWMKLRTDAEDPKRPKLRQLKLLLRST
jgi:hypothetical protein